MRPRLIRRVVETYENYEGDPRVGRLRGAPPPRHVVEEDYEEYEEGPEDLDDER